MPGTVKLYNDDPYLNSFQAKVLVIEGSKVELDRTAFYPEGGGQVSDTGTMGDSRVTDTQISDDKIVHILEEPPEFNMGETIVGEIDWERRYRIMKLHTAAHIMEHFLWRRLGELERVGSLVDDRKDRADYVYDGRLPADDLKRVEEETNRFLAEGHEVSITPDQEEPWIRVWRCGPVEMHCAGTHVRNTSEIGAVRLKRKNPGRGVERVETSLAY